MDLEEVEALLREQPEESTVYYLCKDPRALAAILRSLKERRHADLVQASDYGHVEFVDRRSLVVLPQTKIVSTCRGLGGGRNDVVVIGRGVVVSEQCKRMLLDPSETCGLKVVYL